MWVLRIDFYTRFIIKSTSFSVQSGILSQFCCSQWYNKSYLMSHKRTLMPNYLNCSLQLWFARSIYSCNN